MSKSKGVAAGLALVGGMFGLHKFYLNETGSGIFYLVLTWILFGTFRFPITAFLGIMDGLKLLSMSEEKFDRKYNQRTPVRRQAREGRQYRRKSREERRIENQRQKYRMNRSATPRKRSNPFKTSAYKKYKDFDLEDAIDDYKRALEIAPEDTEIHFNMAAVYSLSENKDKAYFHISEAIKHGFKDFEKILTMDDFAYIRIQQDFEDFKASGYTTTEKQEKPVNNLLEDDLLLSQLNKLKEMRDRGLLSENEYQYEKQKLGRQ